MQRGVRRTCARRGSRRALGGVAERPGPERVAQAAYHARGSQDGGRTGGARASRTVARPRLAGVLGRGRLFVIAIVTSLYNVTLTSQLRDAQSKLALSTTRSTQLASNLADERSTISEIMSTESKHYTGVDGEVVTHGGKLYVAMHDLPAPPKGKVYQAWTLARGAKDMAPSVTFVPDSRGVAIVSLPVDARLTNAVAVSVEPEGGSKAPTTKPVLVVPLD